MLISSKIINGIKGEPKIPGDKSISHRSIIIPSISKGTTIIKNILKSEDVKKTINALKLMGVNIQESNKNIIIKGRGLNSLKKPKTKINLGNSGTSARLLTGLLAAQKFKSKIYGDKSLSKRPMDRIINPLELMDAKIISTSSKLPLTVSGNLLKNIKYSLEIPSAQIKSGIALAALYIKGKTEIIEKHITRDHTEIMLKNFSANIKTVKKNNCNHIIIKGQKELLPKDITVPSDLSSASFFIVAALINKNSFIKMKNINLNKTRNGILKALKIMGANIIIKNKKNINGEVVGDLEVKSSKLKGCSLNANIAKLMIDEYPILSIAASFATSRSIFRGLSELKIKESNRLELIKKNLNTCGIYCEINNDDLIINPKKNFSPLNNIIQTDKDHRIAMAFAVMGTKLGIDLKIKDSNFIKTSFPNFIHLMNSIGGNLIE